MVSLNFNPTENITNPVASTIIFGSVQVDALIDGDQYQHEFTAMTESGYSKVALALNVAKFTYGDAKQLADEQFEILLSSTLTNFMQLGKNAINLYQSWADEMQQIPGIQCTMVGESPNREGKCSLDLTDTQTCEQIRSQMKSI